MTWLKCLFDLHAPASRSAMIDIWRGFAMVLVVIGHTSPPACIDRLILQFHMPLFFIISGYMLERVDVTRRYKIAEYVRKRFAQLIVPYVLFEALFLLHALLVGDSCINLNARFWSVVTVVDSIEATGNRLWFLPCLFVADFSVFLILKVLKQKWLLCLTAVFTYVLSWLINIVHPQRLPFQLDVGIVATTYILCGYLISPFLRQLEQGVIARKCLLASLPLFLICLYCSQVNGLFLMYKHEYGDFFLAAVGALCGSYVALIISTWLLPRIKYIAAFFAWFGRNSLILFPLHLLLLRIIWPLSNMIDIPIPVRIAILLIVCLPAANCATKMFPVLAGRGFSRK